MEIFKTIQVFNLLEIEKAFESITFKLNYPTALGGLKIQSNLVNTTLVYMTALILQTHFCKTKNFSSKLPLLYNYNTQ
jgi:hypothetical protein